MRILTRYILKEIFAHSLIGLGVFSFVLYLKPMGRVLEMLAQRNVPPSQVISLFLLPLPSILVITIPVAVLVGTLIGLSRMAADGEAIAVRAAGVGRGQFLRPVLIFAAGGWLLATWMSLSLSPLALRKLQQIDSSLAAAQANYQIRPRVFIEQFPHRLLYLKDIAASGGQWQGVFIADTSQRGKMTVTLAKSGQLVNESGGRLSILLQHGATHEFDPQYPQRYSLISFDETDLPVESENRAAHGKVSPSMLPPLTLLTTLKRVSRERAARVEINYRLALPIAALALALVALPLGVMTRKGGKAFGLLLSILLVFIYYVLMAFGLSFAKQGRLSPEIGLWGANVVFLLVGLWMLHRMNRVESGSDLFRHWAGRIGQTWERFRDKKAARRRSKSQAKPAGLIRGRFFQILDLYVLGSWLFYLAVMLVAFTGIYMIFDFFQHLGDIVRNHIPLQTVLAYYWYLSPQVVYLMLPLCILVATLVSFSLLSKSNEVIAIKSAGISLYRISVPVLIAAGMLSASMFLLGNDYLPETNQRQDAILNEVKGKPAQTAYNPGRQWIYGQNNKIYNYRFFDPDQNVFADLSVFEINPQDFSLRRRVYAARMFWEPHLQEWVLENGWVRDFSAGQVTDYRRFSVSTFQEIDEKPDYFKKEVKPSEQMSVLELRHYIQELKHSGFDVVRLSVAFYRKFSYPLIAFVIALIAIPFSFSTGRRGTLAGIALSIGIAVVYWSVSSLFQAMGNLGQLPPAVAAWSPDVLFGLGGIYLLTRVKT